jgi:hypothetical protein
VSHLKLVVLLVLCVFTASACFEWTEDAQGNLQSVGLPGVPIWKSNAPPAPVTPQTMGMTPEEAANVGGPVLVEPSAPPNRMYRYRFYPAASNTCEADLQKLLAERAQSDATGPAPYCTDHPTAPPVEGNAALF